MILICFSVAITVLLSSFRASSYLERLFQNESKKIAKLLVEH